MSSLSSVHHGGSSFMRTIAGTTSVFVKGQCRAARLLVSMVDTSGRGIWSLLALSFPQVHSLSHTSALVNAPGVEVRLGEITSQCGDGNVANLSVKPCGRGKWSYVKSKPILVICFHTLTPARSFTSTGVLSGLCMTGRGRMSADGSSSCLWGSCCLRDRVCAGFGCVLSYLLVAGNDLSLRPVTPLCAPSGFCLLSFVSPHGCLEKKTQMCSWMPAGLNAPSTCHPKSPPSTSCSFWHFHTHLPSILCSCHT